MTVETIITRKLVAETKHKGERVIPATVQPDIEKEYSFIFTNIDHSDTVGKLKENRPEVTQKQFHA